MTRDEALRLLDTEPGIVIVNRARTILFRKSDECIEDCWASDSHSWSVIKNRQPLANNDGYTVHSRATPTPDAQAEPMPWVVLIVREGAPEATMFTFECDARLYWERAKSQWSESFLMKAVEAPRDWVGTP